MKKVIIFISILSFMLIAGLTSCENNIMQNTFESDTVSNELQSRNEIVGFHIYPIIEITDGRIGRAYAKVFCGPSTLPVGGTLTIELFLKSNSSQLTLVRTVNVQLTPGKYEMISGDGPCGTSFTEISAKVVSINPKKVDGYDISYRYYPGELINK